MGLKLITPPAEEPVTLAQARQQLRVTSTDEDALYLALITAARGFAENCTGRAFITQTWDYVLDAFPLDIFELPRAPLQSVTSVKYIDPDGVEQTLDPSKYKVDAVTDPGRIAPAHGEVWPSTRTEPNAVTIRFVAGYGLAAAVPQSIKQAMLLFVAHGDVHREAITEAGWSRIPFGVDALLAPYRVLRWD